MGSSTSKEDDITQEEVKQFGNGLKLAGGVGGVVFAAVSYIFLHSNYIVLQLMGIPLMGLSYVGYEVYVVGNNIFNNPLKTKIVRKMDNKHFNRMFAKQCLKDTTLLAFGFSLVDDSHQ